VRVATTCVTPSHFVMINGVLLSLTCGYAQA